MRHCFRAHFALISGSNIAHSRSRCRNLLSNGHLSSVLSQEPRNCFGVGRTLRGPKWFPMGQSVGVVKDRIGVTSGELGGSFRAGEISYKERLESLYLRNEVNSIQFKSFHLRTQFGFILNYSYMNPNRVRKWKWLELNWLELTSFLRYSDSKRSL